MPTCSLSILVARTDLKFMMHTIPHIVRGCGAHEFDERVLFIDTAPLSGVYRDRPGIGSMEELRAACQELVREGFIDRVEELDYDRRLVREVYRRHFGRDLGFTHNFRGYPIYGSMYALDRTSGDYVLHFDSDMLIHCEPGHDWISEAIKLYEASPDILWIAPLSGPPAEDGVLHQRDVSFTPDPRGFYAFKQFTSRKYLVSRRRLEAFLPLKPLYISWKRRVVSWITGKSALWNWEMMVSYKLGLSRFVRADMMDPRAWTLHTPDHGPLFIEALPEIVRRVEQNDYPSSQKGDYDLRLEDWVDGAAASPAESLK